MARFDVCNGDADGLCALRQWQLHAPGPATLATGLKHDIELLERVPAKRGDEINVFDLSLERNLAALTRLLAAGVRVRCFDHHAAPELPVHPGLDAHIDTASAVCTSLLVDRFVGGAFRTWALAGAYGDNLGAVADALAMSSGVSAADSARLRRLGEALNYNAYGEDERDVRIAPARLYEILARYRDPLALVAREGIVGELEALRVADLDAARAVGPLRRDALHEAWLLPDAPWSRRVVGCLANELANADPSRAHAVLKRRSGGGYAVSVRAPLDAPAGAGVLCRRFGGGGRARAAAIDPLPEADRDRFLDEFAATRWGPAG